MALPSRTSRLTDAVYRAHGEVATFRPAAGGEVPNVRVILRRPTDLAPLWQGEVPMTKPFVRVPLADVSALLKGDVLDGIDGRKWRIADAPRRPGDGRSWQAGVEDAGLET